MHSNINSVKDTIIVIEGIDCSGKTELAKSLAKHFGMDFIDTDFLNLEMKNKFQGDSWWPFVTGLNVQMVQFFKSSSGFIKPRYSLSEEVYASYYGRELTIDPRQMEAVCADKLIIVLIDINYEMYIKLSTSTRPDEPLLSRDKFYLQKSLFKHSADRCDATLIKVNNIGTFNEMVTLTITYIEQLVNILAEKRAL